MSFVLKPKVLCCNYCGYTGDQFKKWERNLYKCPSCEALLDFGFSNEEEILLQNAQSMLRRQEFAEAEEQFSDILQLNPDNHEAHFGFVCARYGIRYENDYNGNRVPTYCLESIDDIQEDESFKKAVSLAPTEVAQWYRKQADYINKISKKWADITKKEAPYDIFICFKDCDGDERTKDSYEAYELYSNLKDQYHVFFSRESLKDKTGAENYEPYIFHALQTAKVMIVFGLRPDHLQSTWVKNEWQRYLKRIAVGDKRDDSLIVIYSGFNPGELPSSLSKRQCLEWRPGVYSVLFKHLGKIINEDKPETQSAVVFQPKTTNSHTAPIESPQLLDEHKVQSSSEQILLTEKQKEAVESNGSNIVVIAGPGSGKTRVLTERIVSLVRERAIPTERILALSFSSKATREMRKRLNERLGTLSFKVQVQTFHSFGLSTIRKYYDLVELPEEFCVLNGTEKNAVLRQILYDLSIPVNKENILIYSQAVSRIKNGENHQIVPMEDAVFKKYNAELRQSDCIDYDDMIIMALSIFRENSAVREMYQKDYSHILVDEVQDLSDNQIKILHLIKGKDASLFLVGDDDQCIYEWRGANPGFLKSLIDMQEFEIIKLEDNFRSEETIVKISSSLINNNENRIPKNMRARRLKKKTKLQVDANAIQAHCFQDSEVEAAFIASEIEKLIKNGYRYSDIAVLVRNTVQAPALFNALEEAQIPYYDQISETPSYDELIPILRTVLFIRKKGAINKAINYPEQVMNKFLYPKLKERFHLDNTLSVYDVFKRLANSDWKFDNCDVFRSRFFLWDELSREYKGKKASELLKRMLSCFSQEQFENKTESKKKLDHLAELITVAEEYEKTFGSSFGGKSGIEGFLDYLLIANQDSSSDDTPHDGVNCMTCHKSKGLEFPVVFIPGVQVGNFPNDCFMTSKEAIEAERRLFYVSLTRAIEKLYVTCFDDPIKGGKLIKKGLMAEIPGISIIGLRR